MWSRGLNRFYYAVATLVPLMASKTAIATIAAIYSLGVPGTDTYSSGEAINNSGQVLGYSDSTTFIYTGIPGQGGGFTVVGDSTTSGSGINSVGQVVGQVNVFVAGQGPPVSSYGALFSGTSGIGAAVYDLGTNVFPSAINTAGEMAGVNSSTNHAFLYTGTPGINGAVVDLGTLPGGTTFIGSGGTAINDWGQVAGTSQYNSDSLNNSHAFLYTGVPGNGGKMYDLGDLSTHQNTQSSASAINDDGQIVGTSTNDLGDTHAFFYSGTPGNGGKMYDLGTLFNYSSDAVGITSSGIVLGNSSAIGESDMFLYMGTPGIDGHMVDLTQWLDTNDPTEAAKWDNLVGYGINDAGFVTGTGDYDDGTGPVQRAFILYASSLISSVPEPSSGILFTLAIPALLSRRKYSLERPFLQMPA